MSETSAGLSYIPWYPRDFRSSTLLWPLSARAVYRELLDVQWDTGGLPADLGELRSLARAGAAEWKSAWVYCETKFPIGADGLRRNPRLEKHRSASVVRREVSRGKASKAARARWDKENERRALSNAPSNETTITSSSASSTEASDAPSIAASNAYAMPSNSNSNSKRGDKKSNQEGELSRTERSLPGANGKSNRVGREPQ